MTTHQAFRRQPDAAPHSETINRFVGIAGTGRLLAASAGKERREIDLIKIERKERCAHPRGSPRCSLYGRSILRPVCRGVHGVFNRRRNSAVSAAKGAFATERFG